MKKLLVVICSVICVACSKGSEQGIDLVEQQRISSILTAHYWQISESTTPGYDDNKELSTIYWYKANGELCTGKVSDFQNTIEQVAEWTLSSNILTEKWLWNSVTWTQEITFISAEKLIFTDLAFKDGAVRGTRTYVSVSVE